MRCGGNPHIQRKKKKGKENTFFFGPVLAGDKFASQTGASHPTNRLPRLLRTMPSKQLILQVDATAFKGLACEITTRDLRHLTCQSTLWTTCETSCRPHPRTTWSRIPWTQTRSSCPWMSPRRRAPFEVAASARCCNKSGARCGSRIGTTSSAKRRTRATQFLVPASIAMLGPRWRHNWEILLRLLRQAGMTLHWRIKGSAFDTPTHPPRKIPSHHHCVFGPSKVRSRFGAR